ncbi:MAG: hypothetical protein ACJ785_05515 [Gemmatimonadaceae bacterium]
MPTLLVAGLLCPSLSLAQQRDSARVGVAGPQPSQAQPAVRDTTHKPPMSPRRAFLTSLLLPGYAQTVFGRDRAAMLFSIVEIGSIGMARKAALDLREARGLPRDSVVATYKTDPITGIAIIDPKTGLPTPDTYIVSRFTDDRIKARRTHYEDWIAAIVFNHLFAGADAYVAANLWDFNANIGVVSGPRSTAIYATVRMR